MAWAQLRWGRRPAHLRQQPPATPARRHQHGAFPAAGVDSGTDVDTISSIGEGTAADDLDLRD
eukprot:9491747-Pyramimonas_sp.AAC.1